MRPAIQILCGLALLGGCSQSHDAAARPKSIFMEKTSETVFLGDELTTEQVLPYISTTKGISIVLMPDVEIVNITIPIKGTVTVASLLDRFCAMENAQWKIDERAAGKWAVVIKRKNR